MKASDLFVKCLEEEGIEYIFGVPGEENADFILSLEESDKVKFVLTRHEQGAAFMAEIYGRLTGNPAGCLGTLGPGATNLITGVADANMDRAPMLVLTGQGSTRRLHKESHQIMDVVAMFEPVTKWATSVLHPENIPEIVRKSVRIARSESPGRCSLSYQRILPKKKWAARRCRFTASGVRMRPRRAWIRLLRCSLKPNARSLLPVMVVFAQEPAQLCGHCVKIPVLACLARLWQKVP